MEIINEIKAKVFALYLGKQVLVLEDGEKKKPFLVGINTTGEILPLRCEYVNSKINYDFHEATLLLKPLSKITDDDAIEISKLMDCPMREIVRDANGNFLFICEKLSTTKTTSGSLKGFYEPAFLSSYIDLLESGSLVWDDGSGGDGVNSNSTEVSLQCYQFLQSKGYALAYMQYSVADLVNAGIYKLV